MTDAPTPLALAALHESLGAHWTVEGGVRVPLHYGDPDAERAALGSACAFWDGSATDRIELLGEDRHRFLNGMTTADIAGLVPGRSTYGLFTTVQGRVMSDATVLAHEDRIWLRLPPSLGARVRTHLSKFVITDRVSIMPLADMVPVLVLGPGTMDRLSRWTGGGGVEPGEHKRLDILGTQACVLREQRFAVDAVSLWFSAGIVRDVVPALVEGPDAPRPVGLAALEQLRIEHGLPRFGHEIGPDTFPQEAGVGDAVSYDKGCYLGQEVVARIHYRGGVQRLLVRLEIDGGDAAGRTLIDGGREAGRVTSASPRSAGEGWVGMGVVARRASEAGTALEIEGGGSARVLGPAGSAE